jgi:hypothetical protein
MAKFVVVIDYPDMDAISLRQDLIDAADSWFPNMGEPNMISIEKEYIPDDILDKWNCSLELVGVIEDDQVDYIRALLKSKLEIDIV